MFLENLGDYITLAATWLGALVLVARSLDGIVALTPTVKDDAILAKVQSVLETLSSVLLKAGTLKPKG
jgi:hypothetical protein